MIKRNNIPRSHSYEISELSEYSDLVGRLKIRLEKLSRGRAFKLERQLDKMYVSEILRQPYSGERFPGYENINHELSMLLPIFRNENLEWKAALANVKGVYLHAVPWFPPPRYWLVFFLFRLPSLLTHRSIYVSIGPLLTVTAFLSRPL